MTDKTRGWSTSRAQSEFRNTMRRDNSGQWWEIDATARPGNECSWAKSSLPPGSRADSRVKDGAK